MGNGSVLTEKLVHLVKQSIRSNCSPRHVPAKVISIQDIPYTINGKKVELAVKQIIQNIEVKNKDSLVNPNVLDYYINIRELQSV